LVWKKRKNALTILTAKNTELKKKDHGEKNEKLKLGPTEKEPRARFSYPKFFRSMAFGGENERG